MCSLSWKGIKVKRLGYNDVAVPYDKFISTDLEIANFIIELHDES